MKVNDWNILCDSCAYSGMCESVPLRDDTTKLYHCERYMDVVEEMQQLVNYGCMGMTREVEE